MIVETHIERYDTAYKVTITVCAKPAIHVTTISFPIPLLWYPLLRVLVLLPWGLIEFFTSFIILPCQ